MSTAVAKLEQAKILELVLIHGDLDKLTSEQRVSHYNSVCESLGLNSLTRPLEYIKLNNKLTLYAKKDATDQLRKIYTVSVKITAREKIGDVYVVTAQAKMPDGREDESTGAVFIGKNVTGDALANLYMKAETKSKRRVTLSICGLGFLDETEVDSIPGAKHEPEKAEPVKLVEPTAPDAYTVPFGKFKGKTLREIDPKGLAEYCIYIRNKAEEEQKEITGAVLDFLDRAETFLS